VSVIEAIGNEDVQHFGRADAIGIGLPVLRRQSSNRRRQSLAGGDSDAQRDRSAPCSIAPTWRDKRSAP
jgi:hypothetical protein